MGQTLNGEVAGQTTSTIPSFLLEVGSQMALKVVTTSGSSSVGWASVIRKSLLSVAHTISEDVTAIVRESSRPALLFEADFMLAASKVHG